MKKLFTILTMCLLTVLTAAAQDVATHRIRVKVQPKTIFDVRLECYDASATMSKYGYYQGQPFYQIASDTVDVIDVEMPVGTKFEIMQYCKAYRQYDFVDNYELLDWRENGEVIQLDQYGNQKFFYVMPDHDVELVGTFEYAPSGPSEDEEPAMGSWDPETGTLIIEGYYGRSPLGFNTNLEEERAKVLRYVRISDRYANQLASFTLDYPNCTFVDFSRTNCQTFYCRGNYDGSIRPKVVECVLPATITKFDYVWEGTELQTLVLYATTPPKMTTTKWNSEINQSEWTTPFPDCPNMIVRVPAEAVPLYQADEHWKEYTILAMDEDYANLTVQLMATPVASTIAQYKNMSLVLTDKKSGQTKRFIIDHRNDYEFRYLPVNSTFKIQVLNDRDIEVAVLDNVFLGEENKTVCFEKLRRPHNLELSVTADGKTVDQTQYEVTWLTGEGYYIKKGVTLENILDDEQVSYVLSLERSLAAQYLTPDSTLLTVGTEGQPDNIVVALQPIPMVNATFTVVDSLTHRGLDRATVQLTQLLSTGEMGQAITLTTDNEGKAQGEVKAVLCHVSVTSPLHGTQEFNANLKDSTDFRTVFIPAEGTTIRLAHTYQEAVAEGVTPTVQQGYEGGQGLNYAFTATLPDGSEAALTQYLASYPIYTLYANLPQGTKVHVSATGVNGEIEPVEAEGEVGENGQVTVTLPIVQRGYLHVGYKKSDSRKPAVLLFNNQTGELVKKVGFGDYMSTDFKNLSAGQYLVAVMTNCPLYQVINSKSQLQQYENGKDYVSQEVTLTDGLVSEVMFDKVPLTLAQPETNLTLRRAQWGYGSTTVGFTASIGVKIELKGLKMNPTYVYGRDEYPKNCRLEVYIPKGLARGSANRACWLWHPYNYFGWSTIGNGTGITTEETIEGGRHFEAWKNPCATKTLVAAKNSYSSWENKWTIEWPYIEEFGEMSLSFLTTEAGSFTPEIYLCYTLNGKEYREVLETNTLVVSRSKLNAPDLVASNSFKVSGTAMYEEPEGDEAGARKSAGVADLDRIFSNKKTVEHFSVTVMDGNQPIGKAKIQGDGTWDAWVTLPKATTLSKHNIYAKIQPYRTGFYYNTEVKEVTYDPNAVVPLTTKMTFFNHHPQHLEPCEITFDYVNGKCKPSSYGFSNEEGYNTDFTFEVNLSTNDTTKVYACALFVATDGPDATEDVLWAHYNKRKNRWIAYAKYNTRSLPYSVMVEPYYHKDNIGSADDMNEGYNIYDDFMTFDDSKRTDLINRFNQLIDQGYQAALKNDESLAPDPEELTRVMGQMFTLTTGEEYKGDDSLTDGNIDNLLSAIESDDDPMKKIADIFNESKELNEIGEMVKGIKTSEATGLTAASLLAAGYDELRLDNGTAVYILSGEDGIRTYVDLAKNLKMEIPADNKLARVFNAPHKMSLGEEWFWTGVEFVYLQAQDFVDLVGKVADYCSIVADACEVVISKAVANQRQFLNMVAWNNNHLGWVERGFANLRLKFAYDSMTKSIAAAQKVKDAVSKFKFGDGVGSLASFYSLATNYVKFRDQDVTMYNLAKSLPVTTECDDWEKALNLQSQIYNFIMWLIPYQTATLFGDLAALTTGLASFAGVAVDPSAITWLGVALSIGKIAISYAADKIYQDKYDAALEVFNYEKQDIDCDKLKTCKQRGDCPKCVDTGECPHWPKTPKEPKYPTTKPTLDPSGYVYEGVEDNRLEDVTTTVFYKEVKKDLFGNDVETVYMWDAENYDQINPQRTDKNGEYGWMVPTGLWQVKYEKEGYQTEYSEWLPVPPPQLDVNQGMTSLIAPMVADVKASPDAVLVTFDKPMLTDSLADNRLFVTRLGQKVSGTLDPMLPADEIEGMVHLSNRVRFVPDQKLPTGQKLTLTVKGDAESYANVEMGSDFQQEFEIQPIVEKLVADSLVHMFFDKTHVVTVSALPAEAAAGKKVTVQVLSDMIATADKQELTLNAEGKATLTLTGEAHGTTAIVLTYVDDPTIEARIIVEVKDESDFVCPMPVANYQPGIQLEPGAQIELSCELPNATIYYTLDGTCPCNEGPSVKKYDSPITFTGDMIIKAFAKAEGYADSDIAEYAYLLTAIREIRTATPVVKGIYNLAGQKFNNTQSMPKGIYIINGKKMVK